MSDSVIQMLVPGLVTALLAVELVLAATSWIETRGDPRSNHRTALLLTRSFAIGDHVRERRGRVTALRSRYPRLRLPGHGRDLRSVVRKLQPTWLTASLAACPDCRGSRMRGLSRCPGCARRLIEPAHAAMP